jgi:tetratricopeptide (TPR) repeat protein
MKRTILTGVLVLTAGISGLLAQQPAAPAGAPKIKSPAEQTAVVAIQNAMDPDSQIKAAEDLMTKFADTDFKEFALTVEARAYQQKRDDVHAQVFGERVLAINPKSFSMELLVGEVITGGIRDHDLDRDDKLAKANKLFNDCIENTKTAVKPNPQITDAQWTEAMKYTVAEAHNGLGMLASAQKKWDDAIKEYKLALDSDPEQDAYATRLAKVYLDTGKTAECLAICDRLLAKPTLHPQIKAVVTNIKAAASVNK